MKKILKHVKIKDLFYCLSDGNYINIAFVCDGTPNCENGDDELNCNKHHTGSFKCLNTKQTVNSFLVCNHMLDCSDGSDETFCG